MPVENDPSTLYSPTMGYLYVFNLIVGTGALALPKAFQAAGYALSVVVLLISCAVSYIAATFVIESLSVGNAVNARKRKEDADNPREFDDVVISESGPSSFEISEKIEVVSNTYAHQLLSKNIDENSVSRMASMFLGRTGVIFSYLALNIYLFGDLAIYSTTVPKSLMNVLCAPINTSNVLPSDPCRDGLPLFFDRFTVYRLCVLLFLTICTPLVIVGITKTKYLQLATTVSRWSAFILMIFLASAQMAANGAATIPPAANIHGFGSLFGVAVYAFMCHHSLPSLITPMSSKSGVFTKLSFVYLLVLTFYFTLSLTGSFAFAHVQDVYTLNFLHDDLTSVFYFVCDHFLALFPVFTLTTNYPIVGITLINNVRVVRDMITPERASSEEESLLEDEGEHDPRIRRNTRSDQPYDALIPIVVLGLPTIISLLTDDVLLLATVTGCYPVPKKYASPFQSNYWPIAIFVWAVFAIIMVTLNIIGVRF
uniref:Aa_trans domain-containing protein n=1 Tax=Heligmosomoides polygyrus TaxID=6339 RepID=A0A8L8KLS5_HELPZ